MWEGSLGVLDLACGGEAFSSVYPEVGAGLPFLIFIKINKAAKIIAIISATQMKAYDVGCGAVVEFVVTLVVLFLLIVFDEVSGLVVFFTGVTL